MMFHNDLHAFPDVLVVVVDVLRAFHNVLQAFHDVFRSLTLFYV